MDLEFGQRPVANKSRRRIPACLRCRARKVKCDNKLPVCSNCEKAAAECDQAASSDKLLVKQLEDRIRVLETLVKKHAPQVSLDEELSEVDFSSLGSGDDHSQVAALGSIQGHHTYSTGSRVFEKAPQEPPPTTAARRSAGATADIHNTPSPSVHSSQIGPEQPLAHEVGLLSLGNTTSEPKYLGPSSGFTLARLTYAAVPQSQGLPSIAHPSSRNGDDGQVREQPKCASLPSLAEMRRFVGAYVDAFHSQYPFLQDGKIEEILEVQLRCSEEGSNKVSLDKAMLFLVAALGAKILEQGRNVDLRSSNYLASAMVQVSALQLHDSVQGVQVMLLLVLVSFVFLESLNAWFLSSAIIASCVDLGLQRRNVPFRRDGHDPASEARENVRCGIFWSAYSIDRTLCTILGRPLNLRDEALDVDFPGEVGSGSSSVNAVMAASHSESGAHMAEEARSQDAERYLKRRRLDQPTGSDYTASTFFFRFDRITAEIKLMLYRVAQAPWRFPWPSNHAQWQDEALASCDDLLSLARETLSSRVLVPSHYRRLLPCLEIKYHQCVLLLFRPTPAIPQPLQEGYRRCYESAREVLRIHAEQLRFGELLESWLTAHLVFVSGITMIYSILKLPEVAKHAFGSTGSTEFDQSISDCSEVLSRLGTTWPVARDAKDKFERLATRSKETVANVSRVANSQTEVSLQAGEMDMSRSSDGQSLAQETQASDAFLNAIPGSDNNMGSMFSSSEFLWDELGDMSTWFDLNWIGDQGSGYDVAPFAP
ncbi:hypothetical protein JX265_004494 [Neoarthrinium moseri]|uniref:Zn(2)-C6 fungal-type domain-containing protein n=1 Tax=Neoarthrinium moseri TaxID=1658444 RepID=A0A9P9WR42_9PEZI|nr:hypothetical protein JX265_004494 [Neoarthrinium moseri]